MNKLKYICICIIMSLLISEDQFKNMDIKDKIAQMIMIRVDGNFSNKDSWSNKNLKILLEDGKVGGVIIFGGNIHGAANNLNKYQELSDIPLFVAADYERGVGQWLGGTLFPTNMALASTYNKDYAYKQGQIIAKEASSLGVNMIFAPVMDINNNSNNPIINFRSYSDDASIVSEFGIEFIKGIQDNGLIACPKHYPGHGDTDIDSHTSLPVINKSKEELFSNEFLPFKRACLNGAKSIMVGHIVLPAIDSSLKPATHSSEITYKILRDKWNFNGLIITDALEMGALNSSTWEGESAIRAVESGADIILLPKNTTRAINAIYEAVKNGRISEERINESFQRIIKQKKDLGLFDNRYNDWETITEEISQYSSTALSKKIAKESITVVKDKEKLLPLNIKKYNNVTHILLSTDDDTKTKLKIFSKNVKSTHGNVNEVFINDKLTTKGIEDVVDKVKKSNLVLVSMLIRISMDKGQSTIDDSHNDLLSELNKLNIPIVGISFGSPYLPDYSNIDTYICTYGYGSVTLRAASDALFGRESITGKLPIKLNEEFNRGHGLKYLKTSSFPFDDKINFEDAYDILYTAINDSIFPGAQVIISYKDTIVSKKNIGFLDYDKIQKVNSETIYDVASLTKVLTTTPIVMKLIEQKKISLDIPLSQFYFNLPDNKKNITIFHLLTHSAGFAPYKEYYKSDKNTREEILEDILYMSDLDYKVGKDVKYSDLGIIVLMDIVEKVTSNTIDNLGNKWFYNKLEMNSTFFNPTTKYINNCAPTEYDKYFRKKILKGEVHDENAFLFEGVSGHAGLFSNSLDVLKIATMFKNNGIYKGSRFFNNQIIKDFSIRQYEKFNSDRAIGWDTPSQNGTSSAGDYFSKSTFGHLGFTGTSLWIDPEQDIIVILLTNSVHPSRNKGGMYTVRREFHTKVMETFKSMGLI